MTYKVFRLKVAYLRLTHDIHCQYVYTIIANGIFIIIYAAIHHETVDNKA